MDPDASMEHFISHISELCASGQLDEAELACQELTIQQAPQCSVGWFLLGRTYSRKGAWPKAEATLRNAILLDENKAEYWHELSTALEEQGRFIEAEDCSKRALLLNSANPDYWFGLGLALYGQLKWDDASKAFREVVNRNPRDVGAWSNLGIVEHKLARFHSAKAAYEQGLDCDSQNVDILVNYAYLLAVMGNVTHASAIYRSVLTRDPFQRDALYNFALIALLDGALVEAEQLSQRLVTVDPNSAQGWSLMGAVLTAIGRNEEGLKAYERSLQLGQQPIDHSKLLLALQYADDVDPRDHLKAHQQWDAMHAGPLTNVSLPCVRSSVAAPERLKLGFVSADFNQHPIAYLALPALENIDKSRCSLTLYHDRVVTDGFTERFQRTADRWRTTIALSDEELERQIRADEIDVLFDLMGHTGKRLLTFARKPAPVQVTWLGYVGTTGLSSMDFILADRFHIQPGEEAFYVESVLRMPNDYACYGPPVYAPEVSGLPASKRGYVTFGCFNNPTKYGRDILDSWSAILNRLPTARLLLKYQGLDSPNAREQFGKRLENRGIPVSRIEFKGYSAHGDLLDAYGLIDIALDTQPYSGGVTTCEALWMGVPVITFPGKTFAGRHSTSHLANAGYASFIAQGAQEYIDLAVKWANRPDDLAIIRSEMRSRVAQSPLCDASRFAREFLDIITRAYESHVGQFA